MNRVELSLHAFGLLNAGIHGIHDSGAHAFFLQYLDCLDRGSTGGAHHVLQFSGMSAGLQHHPGTAKDGLCCEFISLFLGIPAATASSAMASMNMNT